MFEVTFQVGSTWRVRCLDLRNLSQYLATCRRHRLCLFLLFAIKQPHAGHARIQFRYDPPGFPQHGLLVDLWPGQRKCQPAIVRRHAWHQATRSRSHLVVGLSTFRLSGDVPRPASKKAHRKPGTNGRTHRRPTTLPARCLKSQQRQTCPTTPL